MLDARLYGPRDKSMTPPTPNPFDSLKSGLDLTSSTDQDTSVPLLAHARRPAILPYASLPVRIAQNAFSLPLLVLGWRTEATTLDIPLFDAVSFEKGWRNVPSAMRLEVQTARRTQLQVYDAEVTFTARFEGLRWLMYRWRLTAGFVAVGTFWAVEMVGAIVMWGVLSWIVFGGSDESVEESEERYRGRSRVKIKDEAEDEEPESRIKKEQDRMSDTERSFPSYGHQPPLRYTSSSSMKREDGSTPLTAETLAQVPAAARAIDADDEDEDEDADFVLDEAGLQWRDSGLGTSMESSGPGRHHGAAVRRRRSSRQGSGEFAYGGK